MCVHLQNRLRYSRERASQNIDVIQFIFQFTPYPSFTEERTDALYCSRPSFRAPMIPAAGHIEGYYIATEDIWSRNALILVGTP